MTDFGLQGPYVGQMKWVLMQQAPNVPIIDLMHDLPKNNPEFASYLLYSYSQKAPKGSVIIAVVDPGVGGERLPLVIKIGEQWFIGPDNGLFSQLLKRSPNCQVWRIDWRPSDLSNSFHGRDLFSPVAAMLVTGIAVAMSSMDKNKVLIFADSLCSKVIYIDYFGNLITGIIAKEVKANLELNINGINIPRVKTFSDVDKGEPLCYENSSGLLEISVNSGSAEIQLKARVGQAIRLINS